MTRGFRRRARSAASAVVIGLVALCAAQLFTQTFAQTFAQASAPPEQAAAPAARPGAAITEINTATEAELDSVRGIGPDLSSRLLAERSRRPFQDWADLITRIKPMGAAQAQRLSDAGLRIHGLPYAAGRKPAQAAP
ncbi:MAG: hypothetical protein RL014_592 [Pseudomonadota bacterium]